MPAITNRLAVGQILEGTSGAGVVGVNASGEIQDPGTYNASAPYLVAADNLSDLADTAAARGNLIPSGTITAAQLAESYATDAELAAAIRAERLYNEQSRAIQSAPGTHIGLRGVGGNSVQVFTPLNAREGEWARWTMGPVSAAGRRLPLRGAAVTRFYRAIPAFGPGCTITGTTLVYAVNTGAPTKQANLSSAASASWTATIPTGGAVVYIRAMGRPAGTQTTGFTATITPASADTVVDWSQITLDHNTATTADFTWADYRLGFLPAGTYTIVAADNATYAAFYPTALLIASGRPMLRGEDYVRAHPMNVFIGEGATWIDITGTGTASVTMVGTQDLTSTNNYNLYLRGKTVFDRVDLTFGTANTGGGSLIVEYWNGSAWAALTLRNNTMGTGQMQANGGVSWQVPADWASTTVNGQSGFWVRMRCSSNTSGINIATASIRTKWDSSTVVRTLSAEDSESEPVWCRFENDGAGGIPACDTGSGHGNENGVTPVWFVDNVDVTATLAANGEVSGENVTLRQSANVTTNNDGTGTTVGTYRLIHAFTDRGIDYQFRLLTSATTTFNPWAYAIMLPVDATQADRARWIYPTYESDAVTLPAPSSGTSVLGGNAIGARMYSTSHPYSIEARLLNPNEATFGRNNVTDPSFIAETVGSPAARRLKFYIRTGRLGNISLASGQTWEVLGHYNLRRAG